MDHLHGSLQEIRYNDECFYPDTATTCDLKLYRPVNGTKISGKIKLRNYGFSRAGPMDRRLVQILLVCTQWQTKSTYVYTTELGEGGCMKGASPNDVPFVSYTSRAP